MDMQMNGTIFWVDMLAGSTGSNAPRALTEKFKVREIHHDSFFGADLDEASALAVFYDCDYLDNRRLILVREAKISYPSLPFILVTLQHSEALAVWAFRQRALDYLVKPIDAGELDSCIRRLQNIAEDRRTRQQRRPILDKVSIPKTAVHAKQLAGDKLAPAVFYVQSHYNERVYGDSVARLCGLSPSYFSRAFRERFKMSFQEFLLRYRVSKAALRLSDPNMSVSNVCFSVGFRDPSYFTRVFKRYMGVSPSEFSTQKEPQKVSNERLKDLDDANNSTSQIVRVLESGFAQ